MDTVEEIREAVVAAHAATTRLTTLVGPLWHETHPLHQRVVDDELVKRAADAMRDAYQPDEGDDPAECWHEAMRAALCAVLGGPVLGRMNSPLPITTAWRCDNCGYVAPGSDTPTACPDCDVGPYGSWTGASVTHAFSTEQS